MTIDRDRIDAQLRRLKRDEEELQRQLHECRGAQRLCGHWLEAIHRDEQAALEKEQKEQQSEPAVEPERQV